MIKFSNLLLIALAISIAVLSFQQIEITKRLAEKVQFLEENAILRKNIIKG